MRIVAKKTLQTYWAKHIDCRRELEEWYVIACEAEWSSPQDVKNTYPKASVIAGNRVVFTIKGNRHRLIVKFAYKTLVGYIRFVGNHQEYDKINAEEI